MNMLFNLVSIVCCVCVSYRAAIHFRLAQLCELSLYKMAVSKKETNALSVCNNYIALKMCAINMWISCVFHIYLIPRNAHPFVLYT